MTLVKLLESCHVVLGRLLRQLIICSLRCLSFGCGHVTRLLGQARKKFHNFRLVWHDSRFREFQGSNTEVLRNCPRGDAVQRPSTLNAAVMQRFARVVALPDPKNSGFPSRINSFRTAELQHTCRGTVLTSSHANARVIASRIFRPAALAPSSRQFARGECYPF